MALRAKAKALVDPIKQRIMEVLRGNGDRLVVADAAADPALPQERARSAASHDHYASSGYFTKAGRWQVQQMRHEQAERGECDAGQRQQARYPGQRDDAGDDGRRSQHDADLKRRRGELEVMILGLRKVALFLGMLGAFGQLILTFAGFRLGAIARRGLLPVVDLLLQRRLGGVVAGRCRGSIWPDRPRSAPRCGGCSWPGRTPTGSRPRHSC